MNSTVAAKEIVLPVMKGLEVCHRCRVCEKWKGYAVKHNYVNWDVLMTILDNYMFRPLLAIFRLSSREL